MAEIVTARRQLSDEKVAANAAGELGNATITATGIDTSSVARARRREDVGLLRNAAEKSITGLLALGPRLERSAAAAAARAAMTSRRFTRSPRRLAPGGSADREAKRIRGFGIDDQVVGGGVLHR